MAKKTSKSKTKAVAKVPPGARTFKRTLPVALTDEEHRARAIAAAKLAEKIEAMQAELAEASKESRAEIKAEKAKHKALNHVIAACEEEREVLCYEQPDFERGVVVVHRAGGGDVVERRTMTAAERQEQLFNEAEKPAAGKKAKRGKKVEGTPAEVPDEGERKEEVELG